jgi:hypothetical protein
MFRRQTSRTCSRSRLPSGANRRGPGPGRRMTQFGDARRFQSSAHDPEKACAAKARVADFSDKILGTIKENRERCRFSLIEKRSMKRKPCVSLRDSLLPQPPYWPLRCCPPRPMPVATGWARPDIIGIGSVPVLPFSTHTATSAGMATAGIASKVLRCSVPS